MRVAIIVDGVVVDIAEVSDINSIPGGIEAGDAVVGATWDGTAFTNPPSTPIPSTARRVTVLAFRNRFTPAEKVALEMAVIDNPDRQWEERLLAAKLRVYLADAAAASYIDLERTDTRMGVTDLETFGIIGPGRALEILDSPILLVEEYRG